MLIHRRVGELIRGVKRFIFAKGLIGILISATFVLQAVVLGSIIEGLYRGSGLVDMRGALVSLVLLILIRIGLVWFNKVYGKWIVGRIKNSLRKRAYDKLLKLGPGYMTESRTGLLESVIVAGIDYLEGYLTLYLPQILVCVLGSGLMIFYVFTMEWTLGLLVLLTTVLALIMPWLFINVLSKYTEDHWQSYIDLNAEFVDSVQGMVTLKAFNAGERRGKELKHKMRLLFHKTMKSLKWNLTEVGIANFSVSLGSSFTLALAAYYTVIGRLQPHELAILLFMTVEVYRPVTELALYFHAGFMGMTSTDGLLALFDEPELIKDREGLSPEEEEENRRALQTLPPAIQFEGVSFSYNETSELLKALSVGIAPGKKLALVGESGSGKTTIAKLLLRFYDVSEGSILWNGLDIRRLPLRELRKRISMVSQDTYLFNGTIEENLRLAKQDATMEEIRLAAKSANIDGFISAMPQGYQTPVGERGLNLSGGQRQRIAIARALLKDAPFIILDEATSSVDIENEREIQKSLEALLENRTALIIAHRLSTVENADHILVLREGAIVEEGRHEELMEKRAYYYRLIKAQNEGERL